MKRGVEQDGLSVGRGSCRPQGRPRSLKCWYSFEMPIADAEGFNVRRRQYRSIRYGEDVEVRRSHQAVACRKRCAVELGKPHCAPGNLNQVGRREVATCHWGVLPLRHSTQRLGKPATRMCHGYMHGKGPDGRTQPAKETRAGHVGLDNTSQPHCGE